MATISLRDYIFEINSLIEAGSNNEAIFHCTNLLNNYPKCIEVYRLLGRALIETGKTSESKDVFIKLLSVIPDDFSAHAGLSEIFDKEQQHDKAIWHLERAFESQPSNVLIQEKLRKLYTARDGVPPAKIRLTRGALIRMYAKGELYQQAISEAQSLLEGDSERQDIKVLLAKMYHLAGLQMEAAETCSDILNLTPYCYEANLIMREIELAHGEIEADSQFSSRLAEVDPYFALVDNHHPTSLDVPSDAIILDKLQYDSMENDGDVPDWARQIGLDWSVNSQSSHTPGDVLPAVMSSQEEAFTIPPDEPDEEFKVFSATEKDAADQTDSIEEELPDWISKAGWIRAVEEATPPPLDVIPQNEPVEEGEEPATPAEDLPEWLKNFNPPQQPEGSVSENIQMPDLTDSDLTKLSSLTTDDIDRILGDITESPVVEEQLQAQSDELPLEVSKLEEQITQSPIAPGNEIPDLPDWLRDLETSEALPPDGLDASSNWISVENDKVPEDQAQIQPASNPSAESEEIDTDYLGSLSLSMSESASEELPPTENSFDGLIAELDLPQAEFDEVSTESLIPPIPIEEKNVKTDVPSWVQKILSSAEAIAPVVLPESMKMETEAVEDVEPLITDLQGELPEEGAISEDVNMELMTWLEDINPDDALDNQQLPEVTEQMEQLIPSIEASTPVENTEISFERLTDPTQPLTDETELGSLEIVQNDQLPGLEEGAASEIHDRLSSILNEEKLPSAEEISRAEPLPPPQILSSEAIPDNKPEATSISIDEVMHLLEEKRYQELDAIISEAPVTPGLLKQVYDKAISLSNDEPEAFEMWKTIGDLGLKKDALTHALEAYKKAERILFQK